MTATAADRPAPSSDEQPVDLDNEQAGAATDEQSLDLTVEQPTPSTDEQAAAGSTDERPLDSTQTRVVLVDARRERRSVMRNMFEHSNVEATVVGEAETEAEAIVLVDQHGAELVVMDFPLPVQDGLKTVAALRRRFVELGIVVCSFNREAATKEKALAEGADAYLLKPVSAREVMAAASPRGPPGRRNNLILNHYTGATHLDYILGSGVLLTTESNIGAPDSPDSRRKGVEPVGDHVGPDVVWLSSLRNPLHAGIHAGSGTDGVVRVVVDVPADEVAAWPAWSKAHGIDRRWYRVLGRDTYPDSWYVVERPIPWGEWVRIEAAGDGSPLWSPQEGIQVRYSEEQARANLHAARSTVPKRP